MEYVLNCRSQERFHCGPKSRHRSFGCAPTSLASPTSPLPGFMGNKLRPKDKHDTFLQTLKQRKGKREMYCGVFQLYTADIATCPLLFQTLRVFFSVNSNYQSQNTILNFYFFTKNRYFVNNLAYVSVKMLSHPAHTSTAWDFSFSLFIYQMPCKGDPCSLGIHIKLLSCIQTPLLNSHLPLVLSRNAEFERGKSVFIRGNLTLQSIVNKRRIRFRFVRLFMQGHDTESIF